MATYIPSESLFENSVRSCIECHRDLAKDYQDEVCPACKERILFSKVKEYIRANDVTEFDVAEHFQIPRFKVKGWIREGRIEYKELNHSVKVSNLHCQECGKAIAFGSLCTECLRKSNISGNALLPEDPDEYYRFLQK